MLLNPSVKFWFIPRTGSLAVAPFADWEGDAKGALCVDTLGCSGHALLSEADLAIISEVAAKVGASLDRVERRLLKAHNDELAAMQADYEATREDLAKEVEDAYPNPKPKPKPNANPNPNPNPSSNPYPNPDRNQVEDAAALEAQYAEDPTTVWVGVWVRVGVGVGVSVRVRVRARARARVRVRVQPPNPNPNTHQGDKLATLKAKASRACFD